VGLLQNLKNAASALVAPPPRADLGKALDAAMAASDVSRLDDGDHWVVRAIGGGRTDAGVPVSEATAMRFTAVYACQAIISDTMAQVSLNLHRRYRDPVTRRVRTEVALEHPAQRLVHDDPNPRMSSFTLRQTAQGHTLGWGNGYIEVQRNNGGDPVGLWPLMPDRTTPRVTDAGVLVYDTQVGGRSFTLPSADVIHIAGLGFDGIKGYSPIYMARQAIGLGLAAESFGAKFFANDAKSGGFLMHPGKLGDDAVSNIRDSFVDRQGGNENAHKPKVLEEGMKWVSTTIAPDDAQFLATREMQIAEIARIYRVPLVLLQLMEKTTTWGSGVEQIMLGFIQWTIAAWAKRWEEELNRKLLTEAERLAGYYFKFNLNSLARGDMAARMRFYNGGISGGWMNRNQARALEDWDEAEGLDDFLFPLNMAVVDSVTGEIRVPVKESKADAAPPVDPDPADDDDADPDGDPAAEPDPEGNDDA